jgi:hypothetical protein
MTERRCPNCHKALPSRKALALHLLQENPRGVLTGDFIQAGVGARYSARIYELRHQDGYEITETYEKPGASRYQLVSSPTSEPVPDADATPPAAGSASPPAAPPVAGSEDPAPSLFDASPSFDELVGPPRRSAINDDWESAA